MPAWKLLIIQLASDTEGNSRFWAGFAYSHSHGDGKSGLAFHRTFLHGLELATQAPSAYSDSMHVNTESLPPLLPCLEDLAPLTISWRFLLGPLLGEYLPTKVSSFLGFQAGLSSDSQSWTGLPCSYDPANHHTGLVLWQFDARTLSKALEICRLRKVKLTGLLHQAVVYALSQFVWPRDVLGTFVAATPLDLRKLVTGCGDEDIMNCVSGAYEVLPARPDARIYTGITPDSWDAALSTSEFLARKASTLADQPIGLLRYLHKFRPYLLGKLGKPREESYEVSNLGNMSTVTDASLDEKPARWQIERTIFSQPANFTGCAINFNFVSTAGSGLALTITWQKDSLGLRPDFDEQETMTILGSLITEILEAAGNRRDYEREMARQQEARTK